MVVVGGESSSSRKAQLARRQSAGDGRHDPNNNKTPEHQQAPPRRRNRLERDKNLPQHLRELLGGRDPARHGPANQRGWDCPQNEAIDKATGWSSPRGCSNWGVDAAGKGPIQRVRGQSVREMHKLVVQMAQSQGGLRAARCSREILKVPVAHPGLSIHEDAEKSREWLPDRAGQNPGVIETLQASTA
ncbi:hypothetical protein CC78DRAFT_576421 [Lojkania enalia]|uniref:Uncharacterized protein n=1 Tax=Lojkania enalia TaxID=147567 RepID=A0A9P4KET9_9PLEO|nr:hypothetical protein CC78DRAFT_576421 [Didymosphaeria enalia]